VEVAGVKRSGERRRSRVTEMNVERGRGKEREREDR
jgi:hypothetical protein